MTVNTFINPDYSSQSGAAYKAAIDGGIAVHHRLAGPFAAHQQDQNSPDLPDMTVRLDAGWIPKAGAAPTEVAAQDTATFAAPSGDPRNDIVYVDALSGTVGVAAGSEAASPSDPSVPAGKVAVARVRLTVGMTEITNADIDDLRALGMLNTGTAAGNIVVLDASARLPAVDGSQLTGIEFGASAADMRLAFLRIAENAGDRLNMIDGIADPFADETDVDTGTSSNETYDASGDYYHNPATPVQVAQGAGTAIGNMTLAGGLSAAFDSTTSQASGSCARVDAPSDGLIGKDWGSGNDRTITQVNIYGSSDSGFSAQGAVSVTVTLQGSTDNFSSSIVELGSINFTDPDDGTVQTLSEDDLATTTSYRYHRVNIDPAAGDVFCAEVEFFTAGTAPNMTLVSDAFTAASAPDTGRIAVQAEPIDSVTVNTDLLADISRDGGTTWTTATLAAAETLADGTTLYEDADVDISGQPSGTSMKWRVRTANNKEVRIHGVVLQWA